MPLTREQIEEKYNQQSGELFLSDMGLTDKDLPVLNQFLREKANDIRSLRLKNS